MKQEDKELILKDVCARLPYGIKGSISTADIIPLDKVTDYSPLMSFKNAIYKHGWRPYLFPLSSMTEGQKKEFIKYSDYTSREEDCGRHTELYYYNMVGHEDKLYPNYDSIDWLNAHHFDYRGLIEKDLAIDCTNLNIY